MTKRFRKAGASKLVTATVLCLCWWSAGCGSPPARQLVSVAAAADPRFALDAMTREFRAAHPNIDVRVAYGSSGNFFAQIRNQAPFDVFLSADVDYPRQLLGAGVGVPDSLFVYAVGRIVVWVPASSPLDPASVLQSSNVTHLAIANPQHAPYGRAAEAALKSAGVYDRLKEKLVLGENITQTLEFAESGAADAGIVALSLAVAPPVRAQGRYWELPAGSYPKIEQGGLIVKDSPAARAFTSWMRSADGGRVLKQYGFERPAN